MPVAGTAETPLANMRTIRSTNTRDVVIFRSRTTPERKGVRISSITPAGSCRPHAARAPKSGRCLIVSAEP